MLLVGFRCTQMLRAVLCELLVPGEDVLMLILCRCASAIRWAGFKEYIFGTSIEYLIEKGKRS